MCMHVLLITYVFLKDTFHEGLLALLLKVVDLFKLGGQWLRHRTLHAADLEAPDSFLYSFVEVLLF